MTLAECLKELGMTAEEFAYAISVSPWDIKDLLEGIDIGSPKTMMVRQSLLAEGLRWNGK